MRIIISLLAMYVPFGFCYLSGSKNEENLEELYHAFYYINNNIVLNDERDNNISDFVSKYLNIVIESFCQARNPDKINALFYKDIIQMLGYKYKSSIRGGINIGEGIALERKKSIQNLPKDIIQKDKISRKIALFWQYIWSDYICPEWMNDYDDEYDPEWWFGLRKIIAEEKKECGYDQ